MVDMNKYLKMGDVNPNAEVFSKSDREEVSWEDEFFHTIYISGKTRIEPKLDGKKIIAGFLQIRGIDYNLEEVYMIPYYKRQVLVKNEDLGKYKGAVCFSFADYDENGNQQSTSGFFCPPNSEARQSIDWCSNCRTQIILIGFLSDENGNIKKDKEGKPYNVCIRAERQKVGDIMKYFFECQELEVPYLFTEAPTEESLAQEQRYFNIFRRVIKITVDIVDSYYKDPEGKNNTRNAYKLEGVSELPPENVFKLLDYAEKIEDQIREKFDLSPVAMRNVKKIKQKLLSFQNSEIFKSVNPNFVPAGKVDAPDFLTFSEPTTPNLNNKTTPVKETPKAEDSSSNDNTGGIGGIDDIPF